MHVARALNICLAFPERQQAVVFESSVPFASLLVHRVQLIRRKLEEECSVFNSYSLPPTNQLPIGLCSVESKEPDLAQH